MTHEVIRHLLDDYVTGELSEDARAPVAEHVSICAICSAEVESLRRILERAMELPKSIDPPAEAWSNIRSAILRDEKVAASPASGIGGAFWRVPWVMAAAAAVVVAALSSTITALYLNSRVASRTASTAIGSSTEIATPESLAAFTIEENNYLRQASMLQDLLDQQESSLAPETVAQLKTSLRTIDEAIAEARSALARDPSNKLLVEMLSANYKQKVDLLRRSTEITRGCSEKNRAAPNFGNGRRLPRHEHGGKCRRPRLEQGHRSHSRYRRARRSVLHGWPVHRCEDVHRIGQRA